ncbi:MAG: acyltransferase family protein [Colwellia sp.]|nr:acyltransferase family protein [Colwellia sp.]
MNNNFSKTNQYRTDIDGLRAIAVLSVILFHINSNILPGGFIGVDIFFVISGYLISLHIFNEMDAGCFSLQEFYRRRIKRIMPAMIVVVAFTLIFSQIVMLPNDSVNVAESSIWSLLSIANIYFWRNNDSSYFAASSDEIPLLHLWSLGVEEQFYIFWPIVLLLIYRRLNWQLFTTVLLVTIFVSSLIGEMLYVRSHSFIYYMLPSRAGELLVGAFVAYLHRNSAKNLFITLNLFYANLLSVLGLFLIVLSVFIIDEQSVFPGFNALIPTVGTGLLLFSGKMSNGYIYDLLSTKILSYIGSVSYSAYLWHWPLLAFYRYGYGEPSLVAGTAIFVLIFIFAGLSYKYIEQKFRYSQLSLTQVCFRQFALPATILIVISVNSIANKGYFLESEEYQAKIETMGQGIISPNKYDYVCQKWQINDDDVNNSNCILGRGTDNSIPQILLWGDSNAAHYIGILGVFAEATETPFRNFSHASCPPVNIDPKGLVVENRLEDCRKSLKIALDQLHKYKVLIIGASHTSYIKKSEAYFNAFSSMVVNLSKSGKQIVLLGKAPIFKHFDRKCMQKSLSIPFTNCKGVSGPISDDIYEVNIKLMGLAQNNEGISYYDVNDYLCTNNKCSPYEDDDSVLYFDSSHIEMQASWMIGRDILSRTGIPTELRFLFNNKAPSLAFN